MRKQEVLLITAVGLGVLLNPLNTTLIAIALARFQEGFELTFADASWIVSSYYLASAIGQPLMGKWSDMFGRKKVFIFGLLLVFVSSSLAPLSPSYGWLIAFRVLQAFGSSALYPAGMGIVRSQITSNQAKALGIIAMFSSSTSAFGPSLGGVLLQHGDWPLIFVCNLPFVIASFFLAWKVFPSDKKVVGREANILKMDFLGFSLFSATIFMWLLFFLSISERISLWKLIVSVVLSILLYQYELRQTKPFIDIAFLKKNKNVTLVYVQFIMTNIVFYSIMFGIPSYLQRVQMMDPQKTGLVMLSIAGFSVLVIPLVSRWIEERGSKPALITGTVLVAVGSLLLLLIHDHVNTLTILFVLSLLGIANGFNNLGMQMSLYENVSKEETGIASGLFMTSRFIGTILSTSILTALFGASITTNNLHSMAWVCAGFGLLMLLLTLRMHTKEASGK